jgi:hypothetical protein
MQDSAIYTAKAPDDNFFQRMNSEIGTQAGRTHLYEMEIRKHEMMTGRIET